ncbi:hypothetical protein D9M70_364810 [compost metagenome]
MQGNTNAQMICVHGALAMVVLMGIALLLAGWVPPPDPAMSAADTALMYQEGGNRIRFAALMIMMGGAMFWPFSVAISNQLKRIEGPVFHPLADVQLALATGTVVAILMPGLLWMVASFRPERAPEVVQVIHDLSWMTFIGAVPPALLQVLVIGLCVLMRREAQPVLPRWFGFFNLWVATGFTGGEMVVFFKSGPFAWNGLFAFWMAAVAFFGWILVTWWVIAKSIRQQANAEEGVQP